VGLTLNEYGSLGTLFVIPAQAGIRGIEDHSRYPGRARSRGDDILPIVIAQALRA